MSYETVRDGYLKNGWQEETTETGAKIFTVKVSDRVLTNKLTPATKKKLRRALGIGIIPWNIFFK